MKKSIIAMALLGGLSTTAMAQGSGEIHFQGTIIDAPCSISADTADQTVDLGQISNTALVAGGASPERAFTIKLEECNWAPVAEGEEAVNRKVAVTFGGTQNAAMDGILQVSGFGDDYAYANNVGIELLNAGQKITLDTPLDQVDLVSGANEMTFGARVRGADDSTVDTIPLGSFDGLATFALAYE